MQHISTIRRRTLAATLAQLAFVVLLTPLAANAQSAGTGVLASLDLRRREARQLTLARELTEVSGLTVASDGRLLAHGDERGIVVRIDPATGANVASFALGKPVIRDDLEGIAVAGERLFVVSSSGLLYETREVTAADAAYRTVNTGFGALCELEGLAYDASRRELLVGCKEPRVPALRQCVTLLRWPVVQAERRTRGRLCIPLRAVLEKTGTDAFHPSSVEVDPATGHYVIVAGRERALLEVTPQGAVIAGAKLSRDLHPQPEGLAFLGDSAMVIADEGGGKRGTLTFYTRARSATSDPRTGTPKR